MGIFFTQFILSILFFSLIFDVIKLVKLTNLPNFVCVLCIVYDDNINIYLLEPYDMYM